MNINQLQQANNKLRRIADLDKELSRLTHYAKKIQDKSLDLHLALSYDKPAETKLHGAMDDIVFPSFSFPRMFGMLEHGTNTEIQRMNKEGINLDVSEVVALQVLGVIAAHLEGERMALVADLNKMGFEMTF